MREREKQTQEEIAQSLARGAPVKRLSKPPKKKRIPSGKGQRVGRKTKPPPLPKKQFKSPDIPKAPASAAAAFAIPPSPELKSRSKLRNISRLSSQTSTAESLRTSGTAPAPINTNIRPRSAVPKTGTAKANSDYVYGHTSRQSFPPEGRVDDEPRMRTKSEMDDLRKIEAEYKKKAAEKKASITPILPNLSKIKPSRMLPPPLQLHKPMELDPLPESKPAYKKGLDVDLATLHPSVYHDYNIQKEGERKMKEKLIEASKKDPVSLPASVRRKAQFHGSFNVPARSIAADVPDTTTYKDAIKETVQHQIDIGILDRTMRAQKERDLTLKQNAREQIFKSEELQRRQFDVEQQRNARILEAGERRRIAYYQKQQDDLADARILPGDRARALAGIERQAESAATNDRYWKDYGAKAVSKVHRNTHFNTSMIRTTDIKGGPRAMKEMEKHGYSLSDYARLGGLTGQNLFEQGAQAYENKSWALINKFEQDVRLQVSLLHDIDRRIEDEKLAKTHMGRSAEYERKRNERKQSRKRNNVDLEALERLREQPPEIEQRSSSRVDKNKLKGMRSRSRSNKLEVEFNAKQEEANLTSRARRNVMKRFEDKTEANRIEEEKDQRALEQMKKLKGTYIDPMLMPDRIEGEKVQPFRRDPKRTGGERDKYHDGMREADRDSRLVDHTTAHLLRNRSMNEHEMRKRNRSEPTGPVTPLPETPSFTVNRTHDLEHKIAKILSGEKDPMYQKTIDRFKLTFDEVKRMPGGFKNEVRHYLEYINKNFDKTLREGGKLAMPGPIVKESSAYISILGMLQQHAKMRRAIFDEEKRHHYENKTVDTEMSDLVKRDTERSAREREKQRIHNEKMELLKKKSREDSKRRDRYLDEKNRAEKERLLEQKKRQDEETARVAEIHDRTVSEFKRRETNKITIEAKRARDDAERDRNTKLLALLDKLKLAESPLLEKIGAKPLRLELWTWPDWKKELEKIQPEAGVYLKQRQWDRRIHEIRKQITDRVEPIEGVRPPPLTKIKARVLEREKPTDKDKPKIKKLERKKPIPISLLRPELDDPFFPKIKDKERPKVLEKEKPILLDKLKPTELEKLKPDPLTWPIIKPRWWPRLLTWPRTRLDPIVWPKDKERPIVWPRVKPIWWPRFRPWPPIDRLKPDPILFAGWGRDHHIVPPVPPVRRLYAGRGAIAFPVGRGRRLYAGRGAIAFPVVGGRGALVPAVAAAFFPVVGPGAFPMLPGAFRPTAVRGARPGTMDISLNLEKQPRLEISVGVGTLKYNLRGSITESIFNLVKSSIDRYSEKNYFIINGRQAGKGGAIAYIMVQLKKESSAIVQIKPK